MSPQPLVSVLGYDAATVAGGLFHDIGWKLARPMHETSDTEGRWARAMETGNRNGMY